MYIQFISDIHLEVWSDSGLVPEAIIARHPQADILVLAGDIGKLRPDTLTHFIDYCCNTWPHVIYVAGNHEFYDKKKSRERIIDDIYSMARRWDNLYFLDRGIVSINGQRFLGCTLWSSPKSKDGFHDFTMISHQIDSTKRKPITPSIMAQWHQDDLEWLFDNVQEGDVVITHFMPLTTLDLVRLGHQSIYPPSIIEDLYYGNTDCWPLFEERAPKLWISGHTHQAFDVVVGDVRWVCNPYGYPGETTNNGQEDERGIVVI